MTIPSVPVGQRRHLVLLQNPGPAMPDGDGGFTQTWSDIGSLYVSIKPATAQDLERVTSGTVLSTASHIVAGPYQPAVTTKSRVVFNGRTFSVVGVANPEERNIETVMVCAEVVA